MRTHGIEAGIDRTALTLFDLVNGRFHIVVNPPPGDTAQSGERSGVGIKEHFVPLARVGHQPERTAGTKLQVGHLQLVVNAANDHAFIAPVKLERLAQFEQQWHERLQSLALLATPLPHKCGELAVATGIAARLDLYQQGFGCSPVLLCAV